MCVIWLLLAIAHFFVGFVYFDRIMKISTTAILLATISSAAAFAPSASFVSSNTNSALFMSEEGGKIVPVKEETVQFTAGIIGGVAGLAVIG